MKANVQRREFLQHTALAGVAAALGTWPLRAAAAGTVNWLAWGGHVEPQGIKSFFDTSGIRVNHIAMSGNAETFAKLKLSGTSQYDLFEADGLWPLRYMQEGMIEPVDLDSIPNVAKNLHPEFKKIPALQAGGGKSLIVPWGWNPTVLIYNKRKVTTPPHLARPARAWPFSCVPSASSSARPHPKAPPTPSPAGSRRSRTSASSRTAACACRTAPSC